ncbi:hypothetical protein JZU61_01730 [bacterium]|nr:hypothetical protein [bacterium]
MKRNTKEIDPIHIVDAFDDLKYKLAFLTEVSLSNDMREMMEDTNGNVHMGFFCFVREANEDMVTFRESLVQYVKGVA